MNDPDAFLQLDVPEGSCADWEIPAVGYALDAAWYSHVQSRHPRPRNTQDFSKSHIRFVESHVAPLI
jgi:hypothetical protein